MLGMVTIWKNTQSGLGEPEQHFRFTRNCNFQMKISQKVTCSCLSWTAGLTWSLVGFPLDVSDTCLVVKLSTTSLLLDFNKKVSTAKKKQPFCGLHP